MTLGSPIVIPTHPASLDRRPTLSSGLERNQVLNRVVMDIFGWGGPGIVFARNGYERIEKSLDIGSWLVAGCMFPLTLDLVVNKLFTRSLMGDSKFKENFVKTASLPAKPLETIKSWFKWQKKTPLVKGASPLGLPFEIFSTADWATPASPGPKFAKHLAEHGVEKLTPDFMKKVFRAKIFYILLADMLLMACKGQGYFWGKNWLTEKLAGKKGFVGEFKYANDDYLKLKAKEYEKGKTKRMIASMAIGFGSAITLPLLIYGLTISKAKTGAGIIGKLKGLVPSFNYSDTIFMSKWVLMWHTFFNWNIASVLSSRDSHEVRETAIKTSVLLGIYAIGDDTIGGALAKMFNRRSVKRNPAEVILSSEKGLFGMPKLIPMSEMIEKYGRKSYAYKLGWWNFWVGLLGACAAINSILPVLNNYYTKQKVKREQAELALRKPLVQQSPRQLQVAV